MNGSEQTNIRLGKLPARKDIRTLKLSNILKTELLPPLPPVYDIDSSLGKQFPEQAFGNDIWGDCVIAGRANWTLRAEFLEQKEIVPITTGLCLNEYWKEQGGNCYFSHPDNGLVMLDSLNLWRQKGWKIKGKNYKIDAFAEINPMNHSLVEYAILLLSGGYIGFNVTDACLEQFKNGQVWDVVPNANIVAGHCVYIPTYNDIGPVCITWGKRQQMTWNFWDAYVDESYGIVDKIDDWLGESPIDTVKLNGYLDALKALG